MPPSKKKEKDATTPSTVPGGAAVAVANTGTTTMDTTKLNGHQQEQELFLQAFEKPTQIYRFLRNRHATSPIFLNRTLSYMKDRMSRNNKKRSAFQVNSILDTCAQKSQSKPDNFLNIIYSGLFDKSGCSDQWWNSGDVISIESTLYKITRSKRKDTTSDFQQLLNHSTNIIYNPHADISELTGVCIPVQRMQPLGDQHTIYKLLFRIKTTPKFTAKKVEISEDEEPPNKRSKINTKIYGCELIVFEKSSGFIPEGDYEAAMQELCSASIKSFSPKKRTWETLPDNYIPLSAKFEVFNQLPMIKFRLAWSNLDIPASIDVKDINKYGTFNEPISNGILNRDALNGETQINHNNNCIKGSATNGNKMCIKEDKIQIVYNFLYSNNTRQQTEYTQEVICPWCSLDCLRLYALLKHLKLCHARFNFTYQPAGSGARIDVTINDTYDGSYAGSPYDLAGPSGCSFARTSGPVRRTSVTNLLVCRPRRQKTCLDEFLVLDEDDLSNQRSYITGHNRLYHHTETCLPVHPKELDIDSEGESDPHWLRQKTIQMIDEFSDVNEGEKELMKLWNLHVMKHGYVGDCQLSLASEMFLDTNGDEIIRKNLYRNFILHISSLFDYGLVSPEIVYKIVQRLQGMLSKYQEGQKMMSNHHSAQLQFWLDVGVHKQDEQKLKSPQKQAPATNKANDEEDNSASSDTCELECGKPMHPPTKRSMPGVKRSGLPPQALVNGVIRNVAKKSATPEVERTLTGKEKRAINGLRRSSTSTAANLVTNVDKGKNENKTSDKSRAADIKGQALKRKLTGKDAQQQQPASKRSRHDNTQNASNLSSKSRSSLQQQANNTSSSNGSATSNSPALTLPAKRLTSRRRSIANSSTNQMDAPTAGKQSGKAGTIGKTATHSLRTRHSLPLTNSAASKGDKR